jgi:large subunit ribosomal protein L23
MDLTIYDVILGPVISDKAFKLQRNLKQLTLRVHTKATKPMIKEAIEKLFGEKAKVKKVRTIINKGKNRMVNRRQEVRDPNEKIAIITFEQGSLDLFDQAGKHTIEKEKGSTS